MYFKTDLTSIHMSKNIGIFSIKIFRILSGFDRWKFLNIYRDNLFVKRSNTTVCFAYVGINP